MPRSVPRLAAGKFFDRSRAERATESFAFAERTALLPEREVPIHTHDEAHFVFVVRGNYLTDAVNGPDICSPSSLIFNPRGTSHRDRFKSDDGIFFTIGLSEEMASLIEAPRPRACFFDRQEIIAPVRRALTELRGEDHYTPLVLEGIGLELTGRVAMQRETCGAVAPRWLLRARDLLQDSTGGLKVSDVAREAGVHPVHLARAFRRYFNASPGEYLRRCKVERARELLESTRLPIIEIALLSGFAGQSDLTRAFRRAFGTTPSAHLRLFRR